MSYILSHSAQEIDEKLKRVPLATESESKWVRTDDWSNIADQEYNPESTFAQSGMAVAAAVAAALEAIQAITDEEIETLVEEAILSEDE